MAIQQIDRPGIITSQHQLASICGPIKSPYFLNVVQHGLHQVDGGLFPLKFVKQDQRFVELWYQLNAYILEMN